MTALAKMTAFAKKSYGHPGILDGPEMYNRMTADHPWEQHPVHPNERWCPNCCISVSGRKSLNGGVLCVLIMETPLPADHPGPRPCRGTRPENDRLYFLRDVHYRMLRVQREIYYGILRGQ